MRQIFKITAISLALLLGACTSSDTQHTLMTGASPGQPLDITFLHINDHHSRLDEERITLELETAPGKRESIKAPFGGFARVSALFNSFNDSDGHVIKAHAGDALTGDLYYTLTHGQADADMMNTICFDTFVLGNHEFDHGDKGLKKFLDFLSAGDCDTTVLSANVRFDKDSPLHPDHAPDYVQPHTILERGGQRIALIGITVAEKTKHSSRPDAGTTFANETETAQELINTLTDRGIDKIVIQSHQGYSADVKMAQALHGVDVIIGGDSHSLLGPASLATYGVPTEGPYPTVVKNRDGNPVCITQAGQYSYAVGELRVRFDENGNVQECAGTPHILIGDTFTRADKAGKALTRAESDHLLRDIDASGALRIIHPDPRTAESLIPYTRQKEEFGDTVLAHADMPLCARRTPGNEDAGRHSPLGERCSNDPHGAAHGGDVQQLFSEALLQQGKRYFDAQIAFQNGGGVRIDIPEGPVTVKDVYTIMPFKNELVQFNISGADIKAVLEGVATGMAGQSQASGAYPYTAGLRWTLNMNQADGQRLSSLEVRTDSGSYIPLNMDAEYRVVTYSFLADGQDHYDHFRTIADHRRIDVGLDQAEALMEYIRRVGDAGQPLSRLPTEHYSTQRHITARTP